MQNQPEKLNLIFYRALKYIIIKSKTALDISKAVFK